MNTFHNCLNKVMVPKNKLNCLNALMVKVMSVACCFLG